MTTGLGAYVVPPGVRPAASLLVLRDGPAGVEVLMLRRAERDGDMRSGAVVFPGGVLDARDRAAHALVDGADDATVSLRLGLAEGGLDYVVAALRECFEEVGLLYADRAVDAEAAFPWRHALRDGSADAVALCAALGIRLDAARLVYCGHWLTPPGQPKRWDTRFFAAAAPAGQQPEADLGEALEIMWLTPREALSRERALKLLPVTRRTLEDLGRFETAAAALAAYAARETVPLMMPRIATSSKGRRPVLPDEFAYAEIGRLDPEGRGDVSCEIVAGRAVRLSPRIVRVTAPNPGVMTGQGTNSYLVGDGEVWTVIDPGPADAAHTQALLAAAAPGRIERILVTHTHVDHSPGAAALAAATGAPVWGRRPAFAHGQDASFAPAYEPFDGELVPVGGGAALRAIHTPGHASNHLCWLLEAERTLFTGDHVMQGSTVVINPPDGDMAAYLRSLNALLDEDLEWLAPGHGWLVAQPHAVLRALIAHRLRREAKVAAALAAVHEGGLDALLPRVYDDVPPALHPVARRSLLAHLLKLEGEGRAERLAGDDERWRAVAQDVSA